MVGVEVTFGPGMTLFVFSKGLMVLGFRESSYGIPTNFPMAVFDAHSIVGPVAFPLEIAERLGLKTSEEVVDFDRLRLITLEEFMTKADTLNMRTALPEWYAALRLSLEHSRQS